MSKVIVWEYETDMHGLFAPYEDNISNSIEDAYVKNSQDQNVDLGKIDHLLNNYEIDFNAMMQTNTKSGRQRQIQRQTYSTNSTIGSGVSWQWMTEKGWVVYDIEAIEAIERAYNQGSKTCDLGLLSFGLPNLVCIDKGYQKNKQSGFVRPIQRKVVDYKAVDGTRKKSSGTSSSTMTSAHAATNNQPSWNLSSTTSHYQSLNGGAGSNTRPYSTQQPKSLPVSSGSSKSKSAGSISLGASSSTASHKSVGRRSSSDDKASHKKRKSNSAKPMNPMLDPFCSLSQPDDKDEQCAICLSELEDDNMTSLPENVLQLKICKHKFHESCLEALYKSSHNQQHCLRCPICKQIHGVLKGDQPPGRMTHRMDRHQDCEGYRGDGMIIITYNINHGIQGPEHPNPGHPYYTGSFPRTAYLPANKKGTKCLKLLEVAFERRLIFTVGTSATTGHDNCVTWTNIHHKTSSRNDGSGHGYPDPGYMDNLIEELKNVGVTDADIKS